MQYCNLLIGLMTLVARVLDAIIQEREVSVSNDHCCGTVLRHDSECFSAKDARLQYVQVGSVGTFKCVFAVKCAQ